MVCFIAKCSNFTDGAQMLHTRSHTTQIHVNLGWNKLHCHYVSDAIIKYVQEV